MLTKCEMSLPFCLLNYSSTATSFLERVKVILPRDCTHYVVPDCVTVMKYLDIFELPQIQNIIILQTVANTVC